MPTDKTRLAPELAQACQRLKPSWQSTTSFINEMVAKGLVSLDGHDTLKETAEQPRHTNKKDVSLSNKELYIEDIKENKEKKKKQFRFKKSLIPFELEQHSDLIADFWGVKTGQKSEQAWKQLVTGLLGIQKKYKDQAVTEQLKAAIVGGPKGPWSNVTLSNYEKFGRNNSFAPEEQLTKHPAQRVFTASGGFLDDTFNG